MHTTRLEGLFTDLPIQGDGLTQAQRAVRQHLDFEHVIRTALLMHLNAVIDRSAITRGPSARHHGNTLAELKNLAKVREAPPRVGQPVLRGRTSPRGPASSASQENAKGVEPLGWHKHVIVGVVATLGLTLAYAYTWALPIAVRQHTYHAEHGNGSQAQMPHRLKVAWARAAHGLEPGPFDGRRGEAGRRLRALHGTRPAQPVRIDDGKTMLIWHGDLVTATASPSAEKAKERAGKRGNQPRAPRSSYKNETKMPASPQAEQTDNDHQGQVASPRAPNALVL